jgi:hypothetical protein
MGPTLIEETAEMKWNLDHGAAAFGVAAGILSIGSGLGACGGGSSSATPSSTSPGAGDSDASGGADATITPDGGSAPTPVGDAGPCANPTVKIDFSPMYSAYIANSVHTFQIPAVTDDGSTAAWSVSDPTQAQLQATMFDGLPAVMITVQGAGTGTMGQVTVYATEANGQCGAATLNITMATDDDWTIGSNRYNDGVSLTLGAPAGFEGGAPPGQADGGVPEGGVPEGGFGMGDGGRGGAGLRTRDGGSFFERDGGTACVNCHGMTAVGGIFNDVSHTPAQTGGFSDDDLIQIITQGNIPDGGYFDPTVINANCVDGGSACTDPTSCAMCTQNAFATWHSFHRWSDITSDEYRGIVVYLRSLVPMPQNGSAGNNFGRGGVRRDGGPGGAGGRGAAADAASE